MVHELKTWTEYWSQIALGIKRFEVRKNDRNFQQFDTLRLMEFEPVSQRYTGRWVERNVSFILHGGQFGIEDGYCVMSLSDYNCTTDSAVDEHPNKPASCY